ncbi:MAG: hypothetical protein ABR611_10395 [Chthoniobacterales bacterium]
MSICPRRILVIAAAAALFSLSAASPARALVLDWDTAAWAPGDLVNSYDLNGDAVNDITVQITSQQANIWATDPTSGSQAPVDNQTLTGGLSPAQNSLMLAANLHTKSACTVQISFSGGNGALNTPGATNVSFTLFDIDITTNADVISNIYGVAADGTHVAPTITNVGSTVTLTGSGLLQELTGNAGSPNNSANGNATISFGATLITDVFFSFGNTAGAPRYQDIAIGDVSFTPVPEINPAVASALSCLLAVGLAVFGHRRAKARRQSQP